MLITKTVCPAGSLLYIVPTGLQLTLFYDARGNLAHVYRGFGTDIDLGEDFMKSLIRMHLVPNGIKLAGGTTQVWGVFPSTNFKSDCGLLPECEYDAIIKDIMSGAPGYRFYVGNVITGATSLLDPTSLQSWASMAGFKMLTTWLVPDNADDNVLRAYFETTRSEVKYPMIAGYIISEGKKQPYYYSTDIRVATVDKTKMYVDTHNGYIKYSVSYGNKFGELIMDYPEAVAYGVQKDSQIILDRNHVIWCSAKVMDNAKSLPTRISCSHCGKILDVPEGGVMECDNPMCTSHLYPRIQHFCKTLGIDELSVTQFEKSVKSGDLQLLPDLLLLDGYKELHIEDHLWKLLYAIIPAEIGVDLNWLKEFCGKCNNQYKTIKYYLDGPRRITTELEMPLAIRLGRWLQDPHNILVIDTIINSDQISIITGDKLLRFDAPPIFHDKTILITGTFTHGSLEDVTAILQSYGAVVVTSCDEFIQWVIVGDIKDNIDGAAILGARSLGIPIIDESDFFNRYQIDEDLKNLV